MMGVASGFALVMIVSIADGMTSLVFGKTITGYVQSRLGATVGDAWDAGKGVVG